MNLDEFEYMVTNAKVTVGKTLCFHTLNGALVVGEISKLARFNQRVIGVELSAPVPEVFEVRNMAGDLISTEKIPAIGEPPEEKPFTAMSTVFVPASTVIAAEWVAE